MKQLTKIGLFLIFTTLNANLIFAQSTDALIITPQGNVNVVSGKVQEGGNDLLPKGAIIMWYGDKVPAGWALCDGSLYAIKLNETQYSKIPKQDEGQYVNNPTVIRTPDLTDRFVVGAGRSYKKDATGGNPTVEIKEENLPPHTHKIEDAGEHSHGSWRVLPLKDASSPNDAKAYLDFNGNAKTGFRDDFFNTSESGKHTHEIKKGTNVAQKLEVLPPYYALYYIMKL